MKIKKIISIVLAMITVGAMSVCALAVEKEYAFEAPTNEVVEEQFPVDFISDTTHNRRRRSANITGTYHLVRAAGKDTFNKKFTMKNGFQEQHNAFNVKVEPDYGTCSVKITGDNGYESKTFDVSSDKTITVKNAKSGVKYKVIFTIGDDCNEAEGDLAITSYIR